MVAARNALVAFTSAIGGALVRLMLDNSTVDLKTLNESYLLQPQKLQFNSPLPDAQFKLNVKKRYERCVLSKLLLQNKFYGCPVFKNIERKMSPVFICFRHKAMDWLFSDFHHQSGTVVALEQVADGLFLTSYFLTGSR
ncbi:hypothetical protein OUZ56_005726 [Daphnia magna]|uniref:Uncharacterized protein n=1 Tax=Daphnia magna TaxID=35525 RepID=A0ABQ9YTK7_9CRUS|nr:hypothetical protein OUZ56_005726 [Daphnia magna]